MKVDLEELERKARAATPGPWRFGDWQATFGWYEHPERMLVLERNLTHPSPEPYICERGDVRHAVLRLEDAVHREADARHIAANDPTTTLALIVRIRELEHALGVVGIAPLCGEITAAKIKQLIEKGVVLP